YLAAHAVPALILSLLVGPWTGLTTAASLAATWLAMWFMGAVGLCCSVRSRSSGRSLLGVLAFAYVGGFFLLYRLSLPLAGGLCLLTVVMLWLAGRAWGTPLVQPFLGCGNNFLVLAYTVFMAVFLWLAGGLMKRAQRQIAHQERVPPRREKGRPKGKR